MELKEATPIDDQKGSEIMLLENPFARAELDELRIGDQSLLKFQKLQKSKDAVFVSVPSDQDGLMKNEANVQKEKEEEALNLKLEKQRKLKESKKENNNYFGGAKVQSWELLGGTKRKSNMVLKITGAWCRYGENNRQKEVEEALELNKSRKPNCYFSGTDSEAVESSDPSPADALKIRIKNKIPTATDLKLKLKETKSEILSARDKDLLGKRHRIRSVYFQY
ncbi:hypothetical protein L3X38_017545 [Prunus dulcis]|uniref:Uncharacterized protein n=1 Tax=Prunus dulcis TaxID=3755 RepID=A0AAD4ZA89_PRUDU|nr:hypothetical protein L3X38_017545 [Prunus dulcis]